ncbi:hypothetical protein HDV05_006607 [Chytridiales sp. JEL 0842]|nr:hypothetical protein HDV05_006607 [Chytridiales sp. JEL 0842]
MRPLQNLSLVPSTSLPDLQTLDAEDLKAPIQRSHSSNFTLTESTPLAGLPTTEFPKTETDVTSNPFKAPEPQPEDPDSDEANYEPVTICPGDLISSDIYPDSLLESTDLLEDVYDDKEDPKDSEEDAWDYYEGLTLSTTSLDLLISDLVLNPELQLDEEDLAKDANAGVVETVRKAREELLEKLEKLRERAWEREWRGLLKAKESSDALKWEGGKDNTNLF